MDINKLIANIKKKIEKNVPLDYIKIEDKSFIHKNHPGNKEGNCLLYTSPSPRDRTRSRMPSSA